MATRIGIASDIEERKWELERQFRETRNWRITKPFKSKKEAKEWLKRRSEELKVKTVDDGKNPQRQKDPWYGFAFDHDGAFK